MLPARASNRRRAGQRAAVGALALVGAAFAWATGCQGPTSITVEVTTDALCADVRGVSIASSSQQATETTPPATTTTKCAASGGRSRIGSLTVLPSGRDDAEIAIRIVAGIDRSPDQCDAAKGYEGCIVARRWIRFQPGVELVLPVDLHLDCKSVACDATSTCVKAGACRSAKVSTTSGCSGDDCLDPTPVVPDAGTRDARATTEDAAPSDSDATPGDTSVEDVGTPPTEGGADAAEDAPVADVTVAEDAVDSTVADSAVAAVDATLVDPTDGAVDTSFGDTSFGDASFGDASFGDAADVADTADTGHDTGPPDTGPWCTASEKTCGGKCVAEADPSYGCGAATCSPCDPSTHATYACVGGACAPTGCVAGYKSCSGACAPIDADHGCNATSCAPCPATNGVASCAASGACTLTCNPGYKLCGGKCVNIGDPAYGCGATTCDASSCPSAGGGTLVCSGGLCVIGSCGPGTKACAGTCVPMDSTHGCGDVTRCSACAAGESCAGGPPSTCQCVPEALSVTCSKVQCGLTKNNCGITVNCGTAACIAPSYCGGGGVPNVCGCTPIGTPCDGVNCGTFLDTCGKPVACGCASPKTCGGGGLAGKCGCTPRACDLFKCGEFDDGCGAKVTCGCKPGMTCGGGGEPGVCGCKLRPPEEIARMCDEQKALGAVCPMADDGCGNKVDCLCGAEKCCAGVCTCPTCECKP